MENNNTNKWKDATDIVSRYLFLAIAVLLLIFAFLRIFLDDYGEKIDRDVLLYLGIAAAMLLLRDIDSFAFGDYKIKFRKRLENVENAAKDAQSLALGRGKGDKMTETESYGKNYAPGAKANDPWNGVFGGKPVANGRRLSATVRKLDSDWYGIDLEVVSEDSNNPLTGAVQFFLHPTFKNDRPTITVRDGRAHLYLEAYGAFTVGAVADNGDTELELDLATDERYPKRFREN